MFYNMVVAHSYYKLYKPYGYLSQFINNQGQRRNKKLLGSLWDFPDGTMAVGRLDEKSEGLLLLTTDGKFSHLITSKGIEKEYHVMVDGVIDENSIQQLQHGVEISIDGNPYFTKRCKARLLHDISHIEKRFVRDDKHGPTSWLSITLTEGRFRQVRKMTAQIGFPTLRLVRVRIGDFRLDELKPGEAKTFRPLNY
ncbi:pseudouridine synthase [Winogradskyella aurantia]|uniref:Pseudouridine synthase n=1 Tax=Winogradskyella aurantia TaxID=1915063 RepID=A0A265UT08_9FLAO|nr:pseudouridine synthase [Winogradskyella aurantia]OZV68448.1 ribulose phosphate epimerase [Winogradskyella aurantia]